MLEDMASDVSFSSDEHTDSEEYSSDDDEDSEDNECDVCGFLQEGELLIQCDLCNKWFHVECTNQSKKGKEYVNRLESWKCDNCL